MEREPDPDGAAVPPGGELGAAAADPRPGCTGSDVDGGVIALGGPELVHEAQRLSLDSSKARRELRWHLVWDAPTAVRRTADWYREAECSDRVRTVT